MQTKLSFLFTIFYSNNLLNKITLVTTYTISLSSSVSIYTLKVLWYYCCLQKFKFKICVMYCNICIPLSYVISLSMYRSILYKRTYNNKATIVVIEDMKSYLKNNKMLNIYNQSWAWPHKTRSIKKDMII